MTKSSHPGPSLRIMRANAGITQTELASLAHVSRAMLSQVERGQKVPSERWLRAVLEALGRHLAGAA